VAWLRPVYVVDARIAGIGIFGANGTLLAELGRITDRHSGRRGAVPDGRGLSVAVCEAHR
jgi:hypothetical protein